MPRQRGKNEKEKVIKIKVKVGGPKGGRTRTLGRGTVAVAPPLMRRMAGITWVKIEIDSIRRAGSGAARGRDAIQK